jgi:hypothetical protein
MSRFLAPHGYLSIIFVILSLFCSINAQEDDVVIPTRHFTVPMAEILQQSLYISSNEEGELVVKHASKGSDFTAGDYLSEADNTRLLNGGLDTFLSSGEEQVIVPVVDDEDTMKGGMRLLGFVKIQSVFPRRLSARRGEMDKVWDMDEGGAAPSHIVGNLVISGNGAKLSDAKDYVPLPEGGGSCITGRDCHYNNGTCVAGKCHCDNAHTGMTGTFCQLYRPDRNKVSEMMKFREERKAAIAARKASKVQSADRAMDIAASKNAQHRVLPTPPVTETVPIQTLEPVRETPPASVNNGDPDVQAPSKPVKMKMKAKAKVKAKQKPKPSASGTPVHSEGEVPSTPATTATTTAGGLHDDEEPIDETDARQRFLRDRRRREKEQAAIRAEQEKTIESQKAMETSQKQKQEAEIAAYNRELEKMKTTEKDKRGGEPIPAKKQELTIEDLYGNNKPYPDPYAAGNVPSSLIPARHKARALKKHFIYSVKFRSGPLGITFDNTVNDKTRVERVGKQMQSELSDIQPGDIVIAVDQYNVTNAPAKVTQRIMSSLAWPRNVVFMVPGEIISKEDIARQEIKRNLDLSVVYPPSITHDFSLKLADWSKQFDDQIYVKDYLYGENNLANQAIQINKDTMNGYVADDCPLYMLRGASDQFGCDVKSDEFILPEQVMAILKRGGDLNKIFPNPDGSNNKLSNNEKDEIYKNYPMLLMISKEATIRGVSFNTQIVGVAKRGICTFVKKGTTLTANGAKFGLIVNTEEADEQGTEGLNMPKGKEDISNAGIPIAMSNFSDSNLIQLHSTSGITGTFGNFDETIPEIYAIRGAKRMGRSCVKLKSIIDDIIDAWAHSKPQMPIEKILSPLGGDPLGPGNNLQNREPKKVRKTNDEGGRISISGENGWAFFDYHLANFGPDTEDLPLTPMKLVMANPPFGCDPNGYNNRISGSIVAVLRGGGCSFGIKVINAQKLGALGVLIVNTDDTKTMRLMALADEIPQIHIPCLMVSRRIQYFLEKELKPYYAISQHILTIQPTGVFGQYEESNDVKLPERFDIKPQQQRR